MQDPILFQNLKESTPFKLAQQGSVCIRFIMHIGIGLNLHLLPGLSEALLSECKLSPAGIAGLTGTTCEVRRESILLVTPALGTHGPAGTCTPHFSRQCRKPDTGFFPDSSNAMGFLAWGKQDCYMCSCNHTLSLVQCWRLVSVSTIPHLPLRPSRWETLQACHKIWLKASSSPRKTFPLTLVEFESNIISYELMLMLYFIFSNHQEIIWLNLQWSFTLGDCCVSPNIYDWWFFKCT